MGWQSYVIGFNTQQEKEEILALCRLHNAGPPPTVRSDMTAEEQHRLHEEAEDEHGEDLIHFGEAEFKPGKQYKKGPLSGCSKVILCGNGGGRFATFNWFQFSAKKKRITRYLPFDGWSQDMEKRLTPPIPIDLETGNIVT